MTKIINLHQFSPPLDKTIVLTTGIFDLLHHEHKKFLKAAKKAGDILLVGLESDLRTQQLKGPNRPINSLKVRLQNLAALNIADYIFALPQKFTSPTNHQALIKKIKPHILAISSHTPNQQAKRRIMKKYGGKLKIVLPHNLRVSTTKTIQSALSNSRLHSKTNQGKIT